MRYGWNENTGQFDQKSKVDYIITSNKRIVRDVSVITDVSLYSDHRLLVGNIVMVKGYDSAKTKTKFGRRGQTK